MDSIATSNEQANQSSSILLMVAADGSVLSSALSGQSMDWPMSIGQHVKIMRVGPAGLQLAGNLVAVRKGDDLIVVFADQTQITVADYFQVCAANADASDSLDADDLTCSVTVLSESSSQGHVIGTGEAYAQVQTEAGELGVVYLHGEREPLLTALQNTAGFEEAAVLLFAGLVAPAVGPLTGSLASVVFGSLVVSNENDSTDPVTPESPSDPDSSSGSPTTVFGGVVLGPVVPRHQLIVKAFNQAGDLLATSVVAANGQYSLSLPDSYTGSLLIRLEDTADGEDYMDEATGQAKDLSMHLRAVTYIDGAGAHAIAINPLTELAAMQLGQLDGVDLNATTAADISTANSKIAAAFGISDVDLIKDPVIAVIDADGNPNSLANAYGEAIAAISGMEYGQQKSTQEILTSLSGQLTADGFTDAMRYELVAGAKAGKTDVSAIAQRLGFADAEAMEDVWDMIYNAADGNADNDSVPTQAQYALIGIDGIDDASSSKLMGSAIDSLSNTISEGQPASVNSVSALQSISDAVQSVMSAAAGAAGKPSMDELTLLGIEGVTDINLKAVQEAIQDSADSGNEVDTLVELQQEVNKGIRKVEDAIKIIADYAEDSSNTEPSVENYVDAGVTGVNEENLAAINELIDAKTRTEADSPVEIQSIIDSASSKLNALIKIANYADNKENPEPTLEDYQDAQIDGVNELNLAAVNALVDGVTKTEADTEAEIEALISANSQKLAALVKIANYAHDSSNSVPNTQDYMDAGVTGVDDANLNAINALVAAEERSGADTQVEVQDLADRGNAIADNALAKITAYAEDGSNDAPSLQDYVDAGVTGVTMENRTAVNKRIDAATGAEADTLPEVQDLVDEGIDTAISALAKITAYAETGNPPIPQVEDYENAGVTGVTAENLDAVNAQVDAVTGAEADTVAEVQDLVDAGLGDAAEALARIADYAADNANPKPSIGDYRLAGIDGVSEDNWAAVNAQVDMATRDQADSVSEVQAKVVAANEALAKIEAYNNGDGTDPQALRVADYLAAGITGVSEDNLAAVNAQVLAEGLGGADTVAKIQANVGAANEAIAKIEAYNNGDGTDPVALAVADYLAAGITGVTEDNLAAVNAQVLAEGVGGANTVAKIQANVSAANEALAKIEAYNNGNGIEPAALTLNDYTNAGITGVSIDNLAAVNAQVLAESEGGANTVTKIQAKVSAANAALAKIEAYNNGDGIEPAALTVNDYRDAGISGVSEANLQVVNAAVLAKGPTEADTVPEIQAIVDAAADGYETAQAKIEAYAKDSRNTAPLTVDYQALGVLGVNDSNVMAINSAIDAQTGSDNITGNDNDSSAVDSPAKVQQIVDAYNKILLAADGQENNAADPAAADYTRLGVNGVDAEAELLLLGDVIDGKTTADVDAVSEIQALADAVQGVMDAASGTTGKPSLAELERLGISGVSEENLFAVQAAIQASADDGNQVDSRFKLQQIVNGAVDQVFNALEKIANYADSAINPVPTLQAYLDAGITGVTVDRLAAVNELIDAHARAQADTRVEVQAIVDGASDQLSAIEKIAKYAGDGVTPPLLEVYQRAGVDGVYEVNLQLVNELVEAVEQEDADTREEVQDLIYANAAKLTAMAKIANYADSKSHPTPTLQDYLDAGITGVSESTLAAVNELVEAEEREGADTPAEVQALIDDADNQKRLTAIEKIANYADNGANPTPNLQDYADAGITGVTTEAQLNTVNNAIDAAAKYQADTQAEVQDIANKALGTPTETPSEPSALEKIANYAESSTNPAPTVNDYASVEITGVNDANLAAVNEIIDAASRQEADTKEEVQQLVDDASAKLSALQIIANYAHDNTNLTPTLSIYEAAQIDYVSADIVAAVNELVDAVSKTEADTEAEVEALILANAQKLAALVKIANYAHDRANPTPLLEDYAAAGITGVDADNVAAINDLVDAVTKIEADTQEEVQDLVNGGATALAALEKIANYADDSVNNPAPTKQDYDDAGVTGVDENEVAAINELIDAVSRPEADTKAEVQDIINGASTKIAALVKIANYAHSNSNDVPTLEDYQAAQIDGVNATNLAYVNQLVDGVSRPEADTEAEIEALLNSNATKLAAMEKIANYAHSDSNPTPTLQDYQDAGITGVSEVTLAAVNELVEAVERAEADTPQEVQELINQADSQTRLTALEKIAKYAGDSSANAAPSLQDYADAGITGVDTEAKLNTVNAAIDDATQDQADTQGEVQDIVDEALATPPQTPEVPSALEKIANYAESSTNPAPTKGDYDSLSISGVNDTNLAAVNELIDTHTRDQADTVAEIQAIVDGGARKLAAIEKIANYADDNGNAVPTLADYYEAMVDGVTEANLAAVNALVDGVTKTEADTEAEVERLINNNALKLAALEKIANYADDSRNPTPTTQDYLNAGVTGVDDANLNAVNARVEAEERTGADTQAEVQALADRGDAAADAALAKIANYAEDNRNDKPTIQDYVDAGVVGVSEDNLTAVNKRVDEATRPEADTLPEVQALVDEGIETAVNALAIITAYAETGNPPVPTVENYENAGVTGVDADNLNAVNARVDAVTGAEADTVAEVQALADAGQNNAARALEKIAAYAEDGNNPKPSISDYLVAGVAGVSEANWAAVNAQVDMATRNQADTVVEVQQKVSAANAALAKIEAYNNGDGVEPSALSLQDYANAGITGVSNDNLAAVNAQVLAEASGGANTVAEIQANVTDANGALAKIEAYNQGDGANPAPLQLEDYAQAGITGVTAANLSAVNSAVLAKADNEADTVPEIQTIVDNVVAQFDAAKAKIEAYAEDSGNPAPELSDYLAYGVTGVNSDNVAAMNSAIDAQRGADGDLGTDDDAVAVNSTVKVQAIADAYNKVLAAADGSANNGIDPRQSDYATLGVVGVDDAEEVNLLGDVIDSKNWADVDAISDIQALANAVQSVMDGAAGMAGKPSKIELESLGITGVTDENLAAMQRVIAATTDDGSEVDSLFELQRLVSIAADKAADALAKIANYADSATNPAPTWQDYVDAGITGVTADRLAAVNELIDAKAKIQADTRIEVQAIVDGAVDKLSAIEQIAQYAHDGVTAPGLAVYETANIDGVTAINLAAVNELVEAVTKPEADTEAEVEGLLLSNAAKLAAIEKIANYADSKSNPTPTLQDYQDAGITGVNGTNLAAVNELVEAQVRVDADTVSEVQALIDNVDNQTQLTALEKIANYANNPANAAPDLQDYADAGITGVTTEAQLATVNSAIDAATKDQADTQAEVQDIANGALASPSEMPSAPTALEKIANYADSSTNPVPNLEDYVAAEISGVNNDNLAGVNEIIDAATREQADTKDEVQALIDAARVQLRALYVIANYAHDNSNRVPSLITYQNAQIEGVTADNLDAVNALVDAVTRAEADTVEEVEALIRQHAVQLAALAKIANYADDRANPTPLAEDYEAAGITGVDMDNVAAINDLIDGVTKVEADTRVEVQAIVDGGATALAALEKIANYADDSVNNPAPTKQDYDDAGVTGVDADEVAAINELIDAVSRPEADTKAEVQDIINGASTKIAALVKIANYAHSNANDEPTLEDYQAAFIDGVNATNLAYVNQLVDGATRPEADTEAELEDLLNRNATKLAAMEKIANYAHSDSNPTPTLQDYQDAGITGVSVATLAAVNELIEGVERAEADTPQEVQDLINQAHNQTKLTAIEKIAMYADDSAANEAPNLQDYADASISGVDTEAKLTTVNRAIDEATKEQADTQAEVQAIVDEALATPPQTPEIPSALEKIANYAESSTNPAPTKADYDSLAINGVNDTNLAAVNELIDAHTREQADTEEEIQAIVDGAARKLAAIEKIANYADNNGNPVPTLADYYEAMVDGVTEANLAAVNALVDGVTKTEADTEAEVERLINNHAQKLAAMEKIANYAADNGNPTPNKEDYQIVGVANVNDNNVAAINSAIDAQGGTDNQPGNDDDMAAVDSSAKLQAITDAYNQLLAMADGVADNAADAGQLIYSTLGVTGVDDAQELSLLGDVLDRKQSTDIDRVSEIQNLADAVQAVMDAAAGMAQQLTKADLDLLGLRHVSERNIAAIQTAVAATYDDGSGVDSVAKIQSLIDALPARAEAAVLSLAEGIANTYLNTGDVIKVNLTLSKAVNVTGVPTLTLDIGGAKVAAHYESGTGSNTLVFSYSIAAGLNDHNGIAVEANSLDLNGGTIKDANGTSLANLQHAGAADNTSFKVDTAAPSATISITGIDNDTGSSTSDYITSDNDGITIAASLSQALSVGDRLEYSANNGTTWQDITSSVDGTQISHFDANLTSSQIIKLRLVDEAGNAGNEASQLIVIDTVAPLYAPSFTLHDDKGSETGTIASGDRTDDTTPTLRGQAESFSRVHIYSNGQLVSSVDADVDGVWSYTFTTPLSNGTYALTATQTDRAGNGESPASSALSFSINVGLSTLEDTPLFLTSEAFSAEADAGQGTINAVKVVGLPADGWLEKQNTSTGEWRTVTADTVFSLNTLDANRLRFVPEVNESGDDSYNSPGVGDGRNDYAHITYQLSDGSSFSTNKVLTIDVTPVADDLWFDWSNQEPVNDPVATSSGDSDNIAVTDMVALHDGTYVMAWKHLLSTGWGGGSWTHITSIRYQRFDEHGNKLGSQKVIASYTDNSGDGIGINIYEPRLVAMDGGDFAMTYGYYRRSTSTSYVGYKVLVDEHDNYSQQAVVGMPYYTNEADWISLGEGNGHVGSYYRQSVSTTITSGQVLSILDNNNQLVKTLYFGSTDPGEIACLNDEGDFIAVRHTGDYLYAQRYNKVGDAMTGLERVYTLTSYPEQYELTAWLDTAGNDQGFMIAVIEGDWEDQIIKIVNVSNDYSSSDNTLEIGISQLEGIDLASWAGGAVITGVGVYEGTKVVFSQKLSPLGLVVGEPVIHAYSVNSADHTKVIALADGGYAVTWSHIGNVSKVYQHRVGPDGKIFIPSRGNEDSIIKLDLPEAQQEDGTENLIYELTGIPAGMMISGKLGDGSVAPSFYASAENTSMSLTGWDLSQVSVTPPANYHGTFSMQFKATTYETASVTRTRTVKVEVVVDPMPEEGDLIKLETHEDTPYVFKIADFGVESEAGQGSIDRIKLTTLPADGTLQSFNVTLNAWEDVVSGHLISLAEIRAGKLRFVPDANESGADVHNTLGVGNGKNDYAQIVYQTSDGSLLGSSQTLVMDVLPVADTPMIDFSTSSAYGELKASPISPSTTPVLVAMNDGNYGYIWDYNYYYNRMYEGNICMKTYQSNNQTDGTHVILANHAHGSINNYAYAWNPHTVSFNTGEGNYAGYAVAYSQQYGKNSYNFPIHYLHMMTFDEAGQLTSQFQVDYAVSLEMQDMVALSNGNLALVWTEFLSGQIRFNMKVVTTEGAEVAGTTTLDYNNGGKYSIVALADGEFLLLYSKESAGDWGIWAQAYDAAGQSQGNAVQLDQADGDVDTLPRGLALESGKFVLYWSSGDDICAQVFNADRSPATSPFIVSQNTLGTQAVTKATEVVELSNGDFAVVWGAGSSYENQVSTRIFGQDGTPRTDEIKVNDLNVSGAATLNSVVALSDGGYVVAWYQDGNYYTKQLGSDGLLTRDLTARGDEDTIINLEMPTSITTADGDEALVIELDNIPDGYILSGTLAADGTAVSFTAGTGYGHDSTPNKADISGWDLSNLKLQAPANVNGNINLTLLATTTDADQNASRSVTIPVKISAVGEGVDQLDSSVNAAQATAFVFSLSDFNFNSVAGQEAISEVTISRLESAGDLEWFNGSTWVDVTTNQQISGTDISAGFLRFNATDVGSGIGEVYTNFQFKLSDGVYSADAAAVMTVNLVSYAGTTGADLYTGTNASELISGGAGDDVLFGNGGSDRLIGGSGNDVLKINQSNLTHLSGGSVDGVLGGIDGGEGVDTLSLVGSGLQLDFTNIDRQRVTDIEKIDITGSGDNSLKLTINDVLDMSSTSNKLYVDANAGDSVYATGFVNSGSSQMVDGTIYNVYTESGAQAVLWIDQNATVVI